MKSETGNRKIEKWIPNGLSLLAFFLLGGCVSPIGSRTKGTGEANASAAASITQTISSESGNWHVVYENDFSSYAVGQEPEDLFILDGSFAVREVENNKVLGLPGTPIGDFGILFGPRVKGKPVELRCRLFSSRKGRRLPAFAAGLGGVNGYRIRLNPAVRKTQLFRGEEPVATTSFQWESGSWTNLRLRAEPKGKTTTVSAKVWGQGGGEPAEWTLVHEDAESFDGGKCSLWGLPYASTDILFDDLQVFSSSP